MGYLDRPHILLTIGTDQIVTLIDSGSCSSLLDYSIYKSNPATNQCALKPTQPLRTVTNQPISVKGEIELLIGNIKTNMVIVENLGAHMLLGSDTLQNNSGSIDYQRHSVSLAGKKYAFVTGSNNAPTIAEVVSDRELQLLFNKYPNVFHESDNKLSCAKGFSPMTIITEGDPVYQRPYRAALNNRQIIEDSIKNMLDDGIISPSDSPWSAPITLVPKKDGTRRFCVDYRKLNEKTKRSRFPIPSIQTIFDTVGSGKIFTTLDLKSGYWQLPIAECDKEKTAFSCHAGHFQYNRIPFGLTNAPAFFQRAMCKILNPLIGKCLLIYIDDLVVYSPDKKQHLADLEEVFKLLTKHNLKLRRSKCDFGKPKVELLGFEIDSRGIVRCVLFLLKTSESMPGAS